MLKLKIEMRNVNIITGVRSKNGYTKSHKEQEGVFKTSRGRFAVKVRKDTKLVLLDQYDTKKEAVWAYNEFKKQ